MPTKLTIEESYGFQIIDTPELKAKFAPKLESDEVCHRNFTEGWYKPRAESFFNSADLWIYRRRISVGEGFELVPLDEKIQDGDEMLTACDSLGFFAAGKPWFGTTPRSGFDVGIKTLAFRRRKSPSSGWIKLTPETLPKAEDYPCWVTDGKEVEQSLQPRDGFLSWNGTPDTFGRSNVFDRAITHWQRKPREVKPEPPKPEKSKYDLALELIHKEIANISNCNVSELTVTDRNRIKLVFDAALAFAKKKGGQ